MKKGQKIKVSLERVPIYYSPGYVGTGKITEQVLELTEKESNDVWLVKGVNWTRRIGDVKVSVFGRLVMLFDDGGNLYTSNCRYECEILEAV